MTTPAMPFKDRYSATVEETAAATGISRSKIWELIKDEKIATTREPMRVDYGIPGTMDRLSALGNAVVPQIPEIIGRAIMKELEGGK